MIVVIKAPSPLEWSRRAGPKIFLAGSIEQGAAPNWQQEVTEYLMNRNAKCVLLNPRRDDWDKTWLQEYGENKFTEQVSWELDAMRHADLIMMYFAPGTMSPITLLEFGLYAADNSKKLVVCCPEGFHRKGNVDVTCKYYQVPRFASLYDLKYQVSEWLLRDESVLLGKARLQSEGF